MSKPLFIFGTLRFEPLLEALIGPADHLPIHSASLPDYALLAVLEEPFPMIEKSKGNETEGLCVHGLSADAYAALDYYQRAAGCDLCDVVLKDGTSANAYIPSAANHTANDAWSFEDWVRDWSDISLFEAQDVMSYRDQKTPEQIARMLPMIRARAASRVNARSSRHGDGTLNGHVDIAERRRVYAEYFAVDEYDLHHTRFDGKTSPQVTRAVFLAPDAALVLPYDPFLDTVLLVEQMRMGPLGRGDPTLWQYEPIAGRLDPGETAQEAARREAIEEANLELGDLLPVAEVYCSPGTSSEFYYIFVGIADLSTQTPGLGGLAAEDEDIRAHIMPFGQLLDMCDSLQAANAPLALAANWLARHRSRLRKAAKS